MKSEYLLDAIGLLDGELIVEAEEKPARRKVPLWQTATAAAAALAVCAGLYLLPAMQPAGTAAPEHQGVDNETSDVADIAGGTLADGALLDEYKYKTESDRSSLHAPSTAGKDGVGEMGIAEPQFFTQRGVYLLTAIDFMQTLPENVRYLGELSDVTDGEWSYPAVRSAELVGRNVWESEDGEYLYVQMPQGGWWTAKLSR